MLHLHLTKLLGTKLLGGSLDDVSGQWVWAAHDTNWIYQDGPAPNREVYYNQYVPRPWGSVARCAAMASVCGGMWTTSRLFRCSYCVLGLSLWGHVARVGRSLGSRLVCAAVWFPSPCNAGHLMLPAICF